MNIAVLLRSTAIFMATLSLAWSQAVQSPNPLNPGDTRAPSDQSLKQPAVLPIVPKPGPDPLLDLPSLKPSRASLLGGAVESVDRLRGRFILRPFGRGKLTVAFDPRTQFLRGEEAASARDLHPGDRVYVETVLDGSAVFAKSIHLSTDAGLGTAVGQVISYDPAQGNLSLHDQLTSRPVRFRVNSTTTIAGASIAPGALVQLTFMPGKDSALAHEIVVLAAPGSIFTFAGRITFLDLASHELVVANISDDNRYEIQFNPAKLEVAAKEHLQEGANVTIAAKFDGQRYVAESVTVLPELMD